MNQDVFIRFLWIFSPSYHTRVHLRCQTLFQSVMLGFQQHVYAHGPFYQVRRRFLVSNCQHISSTSTHTCLLDKVVYTITRTYIPPHVPECKLRACDPSSSSRPLNSDQYALGRHTLKLNTGSWLELRLSQSRGGFANSYYEPTSCPLEPGNLPPATSICNQSAGSVLAPDCHHFSWILTTW